MCVCVLLVRLIIDRYCYICTYICMSMFLPVYDLSFIFICFGEAVLIKHTKANINTEHERIMSPAEKKKKKRKIKRKRIYSNFCLFILLFIYLFIYCKFVSNSQFSENRLAAKPEISEKRIAYFV